MIWEWYPSEGYLARARGPDTLRGLAGSLRARRAGSERALRARRELDAGSIACVVGVECLTLVNINW